MVPVVRPTKVWLLTGAGFSKPYGGYLSSEFWALIFRQRGVRDHYKISSRMRQNLNFEEVYEEVMTRKEYSAEERAALVESVWNSYQLMHKEMESSVGKNGVYPQFISRFAGSESGAERGFAFTLNQDLLVETFHSGDVMPVIPGSQLGRYAESFDLPNDASVTAHRDAFWSERAPWLRMAYVKLHGSSNWWTAGHGERALVIGVNKDNWLTREPLLAWYFDLFKEVLDEPDGTLLTIGYSFRDRHINSVILNAVERKADPLKLFVMDTKAPEEFKKHLESVPKANHIRSDAVWKAMHAYYQGSVENYFWTGETRLPPRGEVLFRDLGIV